MNRRDFLLASAATAIPFSMAAGAGDGANATTPPAAPPGPKPAGDPVVKKGRTLRAAVMYGMIADESAKTTLDKFKLLKDCGFEGVEMDSPSQIPVEEVLAARDATGIVVHGLVNSVHWRTPLNSPGPEGRARALAALRTCISDAKRLGSTSILLVPAVVNAELSYDQAWEKSQSAIGEVLAEAEAANVTIAIENVWNNFLLSPLEAAQYVDAFKSPRVAWHLDIGNVVNFGWPEHWVRILGKRIVKLHIKDFSRTKRDKQGLWQGFDVELGAGDAGWARVMAALDETGYTTAKEGNWATAEVRGGDRARLTQVREQMAGLFEA